MKESPNHTEDQLLTGFRQGHEASFSIVFNALYPALCFYALKYTHDLPAAEDIAEDSFLKVWDRRQAFFQWNVLKSYLYTTVRHTAINWTRQQQRHWAFEKEIKGTTPAQEEHILDHIVRAEMFRELFTALEALPPQCRKIVTMLYKEEKTARQVAEELDLSLTTVKSQKARGLLLLRKRLPYLLFLLAFL
jgi:RNA polymerase sigma-70 factor (ECF subfamily)